MLILKELQNEIEQLERSIIKNGKSPIIEDGLDLPTKLIHKAEDNPNWQLELVYIFRTYFPNRRKDLFSDIINSTRNEYLMDEIF